MPEAVAQLGRVPGRGGTRLNAACRLAWPAGYASWPALFAGSALVHELHNALAPMATNADAAGDAPSACSWTVKDVEAVLFMDGC